MPYDQEFDEGAWKEEAARVKKELADHKERLRREEEREREQKFINKVARNIEVSKKLVRPGNLWVTGTLLRL